MSTVVTDTASTSSYIGFMPLHYNRALAACTFFLCALLPALILAYSLDHRTVLDVNIWIKPIKFAIALGIYAFTLSLYITYLPASWRDSKLFNAFVGVVIFTILGEMLWLIFAASIGEPSHFNQSHPVLAPVYFLMGVFATILTALSLVVGIGILRNPVRQLKPVLHYSLAYGLIVTFILTMTTAGYMASNEAQSHTVAHATTTATTAELLPIVGWVRNAGDLRVSHFFATHALHALPLVAWLLLQLLPERMIAENSKARKLALFLTAGYSLIVAATFFQATSAYPFI